MTSTATIHKTDLEIMADTVTAEPGRVVLLQAPSGKGSTIIARRLSCSVGVAFRAPHHTCSVRGLVEETGIAAGGVLFLDNWQEFRASALRRMWSVWEVMDPAVRPMIVLAWHPCLKADNFDTPEHHWGHIQKLAEHTPPIDDHLVWGFDGQRTP